MKKREMKMVAAQIKKVRSRSKIGQVALSKEIKISQSQMSKIENAKTSISATAWATFCKKFEVDPFIIAK